MHVILCSSILHPFVEHGVANMQAVVDEWASSLFRVCIGFLVFSPELYSRVCVIANYVLSMALLFSG